MLEFFILEDKKPVKVLSSTYSDWFKTADRKVALAIFERPNELIEVSTMFIGVSGNLFDTAIFITNKSDQSVITSSIDRAYSWDDAVALHAKICEAVKGVPDDETPWIKLEIGKDGVPMHPVIEAAKKACGVVPSIPVDWPERFEQYEMGPTDYNKQYMNNFPEPSHAYIEGYHAGRNDSPRNDCPYFVDENRKDWYNGWKEGRKSSPD